MNISIGFDHGAVALRDVIISEITTLGHQLIDHGTQSNESVDYPDYAALVCKDVIEGNADYGILCCTTGIGMSMAANKMKGIRAALVHYDDQARLTRQHNDANVLCLGALHTSEYEARLFVNIFLTTAFEGGRHERRICKFGAWES